MCDWLKKNWQSNIMFECVDEIPTLEEELEFIVQIQEDTCETHKVFCCEICFGIEEE